MENSFNEMYLIISTNKLNLQQTLLNRQKIQSKIPPAEYSVQNENAFFTQILTHPNDVYILRGCTGKATMRKYG